MIYTLLNGKQSSKKYNLRQRIGLGLGLVLFGTVLLLPVEIHSPAAKTTLAIAVLMATWWVTEALPIPVVSLLPVVLFPSFGIMSPSEVSSQYGHRLIFLFMAGFLIAVAMQKWDLHKRIALYIIRTIGTGPKRIILGFMVASGFLSIWISNTATTMMMTTIGLAVVSYVSTTDEQEETAKSKLETNFGVALMLGIAYSCSIGGIGTIIGTPPNALLVAFMEENFNQEISFLNWMVVGLPIVTVLLPIAWWYLTNISSPIRLEVIPGGVDLIEKRIIKLGPMRKGEKRVLTVFVLTAFLWMIRSFVITPFLPQVGDATIGIAMAVLLFLIPVNLNRGQFALDWFTHLPVLLFLFITITLMVSLTELSSNTGTAAMMLPVLVPLTSAMNVDFLTLALPAIIAVSGAFMLPVATPPNAIVFGTGHVTIPQMVKNGIGLNLIAMVVTTGLGYFLLKPLIGLLF